MTLTYQTFAAPSSKLFDPRTDHIEKFESKINASQFSYNLDCCPKIEQLVKEKHISDFLVKESISPKLPPIKLHTEISKFLKLPGSVLENPTDSFVAYTCRLLDRAIKENKTINPFSTVDPNSTMTWVEWFKSLHEKTKEEANTEVSLILSKLKIKQVRETALEDLLDYFFEELDTIFHPCLFDMNEHNLGNFYFPGVFLLIRTAKLGMQRLLGLNNQPIQKPIINSKNIPWSNAHFVKWIDKSKECTLIHDKKISFLSSILRKLYRNPLVRTLASIAIGYLTYKVTYIALRTLAKTAAFIAAPMNTFVLRAAPRINSCIVYLKNMQIVHWMPKNISSSLAYIPCLFMAERIFNANIILAKLYFHYANYNKAYEAREQYFKMRELWVSSGFALCKASA